LILSSSTSITFYYPVDGFAILYYTRKKRVNMSLIP